MAKTIEIKPATGKLGVLIPGMGAVATTLWQVFMQFKKVSENQLVLLPKWGLFDLANLRINGKFWGRP